jgi:hypothetical protein
MTKLKTFLITKKFERENALLIKKTGSEVLAKSCWDPFDYLLKLKTGEIINYSEARLINDDWIHLDFHDYQVEQRNNEIPSRCNRGIDVKLSEIVWVIDAPYES